MLIGVGIYLAILARSTSCRALWFIFIGMFLGQAARSATYQTAVLSRIEGIPVRT